MRAKELREIRAIREANRKKLDAKLSRVDFYDLDWWFDNSTNLAREADVNADLIVAVSGAALPSIGAYWAGVIVVNTDLRVGKAWLNDIEGACGFDTSPVVVRAGMGNLIREHSNQICTLFDRLGVGAFVDVPQKCYDGSPVTFRILCGGQETTASVNTSDVGGGPSMRLGRLVWKVVGSIHLEETERYIPPVEQMSTD